MTLYSRKAHTLSLLDKVPRIGKKRKKAIILRFGSAKTVAEVYLIDLQKVREYKQNLSGKNLQFCS